MQQEMHPRLTLSQWPTPIEHLERLSAALGGPRIFMKRDDFGSVAMGGNKLRKLEYLLADAQAKGCNVIVTSGALQSNSARLTAAAAAKLGLECHLVLIDEVPDRLEAYYGSANRLIENLVDAKVHLVQRNANLAEAVTDCATQLQEMRKSPYVIPLGCSNPIGCLGYVTCAFEISEQERAMEKNFTHIFVVSGSAGTHAGLLAGLHLTKSKAKLVGATISRSAEKQRPIVEALVAGVSALVGADAAAVSSAIVLEDGMYLPGYGLPNEFSRQAIMTCAKYEGILLDPVYTSKAMAVLFQQIESGLLKPSHDVLFIHTGGTPGLFAYPEIFSGSKS
ncbi:D-cysteine desulfhydrase family protein [Phyllobacterium zundukense]|uniref:Pyridoxal-5'-phosphate-dependent protein n=1 Tax=Phyllobacterium zundukense TaxID=1867719 RepID=A0A2N9W365_9HYPH|nr:D-cysteine desulfhydrase family protein [Phyllobacterium zundukense]ATU94387.1 pyridoxal-5'-phosphate-dependent protein [Phyllobacterium zundukense]PIO46183.1 pyridoxal-5'-phosphate-dependent protein [Phyllobacterium zundukense]